MNGNLFLTREEKLGSTLLTLKSVIEGDEIAMLDSQQAPFVVAGSILDSQSIVLIQ